MRPRLPLLSLLALAALAAAAAAGPATTETVARPGALEILTRMRALEALSSIEAGKPLARFIAERPVTLYFSGMNGGTHGGFGTDSNGNPVILLRRLGGPELDTVEKGAVFLAMVIAHEATHARQKLDWELSPSVEQECEAFLKEMEIHHALRNLPNFPGAPFEMELRYRLLFEEGGVDRLVEQVRDAYAANLFQKAGEEASAAPAPRREAARKRILETWKHSGESDHLRPVDEMIREARGPERRARLEAAREHWRRVLAAFKADFASWNPPDSEKPAAPPAPSFADTGTGESPALEQLRALGRY
mgnify:CR=1 FL=1